MTTPSNSPDRPPLKTIDKSGTYTLRLCKPKPEKIKMNTAGFPSCSIFFTDAEGNCLNKNYSTQFGTKQIAMLVGKFSGKYVQSPEQFTLQQFGDLINQAANCVAAVDIEVTPNGEWNGKPQYRYKFKKIESILGRSANTGEVTLSTDNIPDLSKDPTSDPF